tara:strand:+ start:377 stop:841 length:465 start_codon:yes stop_codon:yes gene_type:complete
MIDDLINVAIFAILMLSLVQKGYKDTFVAVVFASGIWAHELLFSHLNSVYYFLSAGALDALVIIFILRFSSKLSNPLSIICLISIAVNFVGLAFWWNFYEPTTYNSLILCLYFVAIYILMGGQNGLSRAYGKLSIFCRSNYKNVLLHSSSVAKK